jgi:hypothetical protein
VSIVTRACNKTERKIKKFEWKVAKLGGESLILFLFFMIWFSRNLEKSWCNSLSKKKSKRKASKKESGTFGTVLMLFGCFLVVLVIGWYMMVGHLDGETYHGVVELPLKESYANPVYALALIHWVIGIPSVMVFYS